MTDASAARESALEAPPADANGMEWAFRRGMGALAEKMGMEFLEFSLERCVATMPVEGTTQPVGLMHGGAYVVLAESLGSMAANLHAGPGRLAVGVDINATHTRSARSGVVTGVCTPIHLGRSMTVHDIVVTDEQGRRLSTIRITNMIKDLPREQRAGP
jgi:1,4-dihydroxy-2-naphthoyl-CoA hydrolase